MTIEANGAACERISERYQPDYSFAEGQRYFATVEKEPFLAVESGSNTRTTTLMKEFATSNARYSYSVSAATPPITGRTRQCENQTTPMDDLHAHPERYCIGE